MKKLSFFFAMFASITASATVAVTPLAIDYANKKVTFRVAWSDTAANNRVWVWVDLCPVAGTSPGTFAKAVISGATATAGSIDAATLNGRGFYVTTNPSTVTATLSNATGQFNWCAYGSDFPPKVTANNGAYTLYGTPPFTLIEADGMTTQTVAATAIAISAVTITPVTLTDQTGCPGDFCIYSGSDLFIDGTHLCQQRATGAQNWEAWIKDTRDDELYRIVKMPDNNWWLAQNVRLERYNSSEVGIAVTNCTKEECGRWYTHVQAYGSYGGTATGYGASVQGVCPNGWILPVTAIWNALASAWGTPVKDFMKYLTPPVCVCDSDDAYGWINQLCIHHTKNPTWGQSYVDNTGADKIFLVCSSDASDSRRGTVISDYDKNMSHTVRCFRQL